MQRERCLLSPQLDLSRQRSLLSGKSTVLRPLYLHRPDMAVVWVPEYLYTRCVTAAHWDSCRVSTWRGADHSVGKTASGNEALLECGSNSWCCDANRPDVGCCDTSTSRFSLSALNSGTNSGSDPASIIGSMGGVAASMPSITPNSTAPNSASTSSNSQLSSLPDQPFPTASHGMNVGNTDTSHATQSASAGTNVDVFTSVTINSAGGSSTLITSTSSIVPAAPASVTSVAPGSDRGGPTNSTNLGPIVGPAVAVPVVVLLLAALAFFFYRRRRNRNRAQETPGMQEFKAPIESPFVGFGKSELEGSPGTPVSASRYQVGYHTPDDVGAGLATTTDPPSYRGVSGVSQTPNGLGVSRDSRASELAASPFTGISTSPRGSELQGSPAMGVLDEVGPQELPGSTYHPLGRSGGGAPH